MDAHLSLEYNVPDTDQWTWYQVSSVNGVEIDWKRAYSGLYPAGLGKADISVGLVDQENWPDSFPYTFTKAFVAYFRDGRTYAYFISITCRQLPGLIPPSDVQITYGWVTGLGQGGTSTGPAVPAGFVLKTITCDVAVFNTPGGYPVGDNRLKAGQTWFVNPTPTKDDKGKSWTEVFPGGYSNGFVPTSCVQ
jgi:hypothetical protein